MRQERRAEAQSLLQMIAGIAQVAAVSGTPINLKAPIENLLDAYDVVDKEKFFAPSAPPGMGAPPGLRLHPVSQRRWQRRDQRRGSRRPAVSVERQPRCRPRPRCAADGAARNAGRWLGRRRDPETERVLAQRQATLTALTKHPSWPELQAEVARKRARIEKTVMVKVLRQQGAGRPDRDGVLARLRRGAGVASPVCPR